MGCFSSRLATDAAAAADDDVPLESLLPAWALRNPVLTAAQNTLLHVTFKQLATGTAVHRALVRSSSSSAAASQPPPADSSAAPPPADSSSAPPPADSLPEDDPLSSTYSPIAFFFDTFYTRLFEVAPSVRPLFKSNMKTQGRALVRMLDAALNLLSEPEQLHAALTSLALRHLAYGVEAAQYATVGEVLLYALEKCLGPELWTPDVALAWLTTYSLMLSVILPAAYGKRSTARKLAAARAAAVGVAAAPASAVAAAVVVPPASPAAAVPSSPALASAPAPDVPAAAASPAAAPAEAPAAAAAITAPPAAAVAESAAPAMAAPPTPAPVALAVVTGAAVSV